jgi:hypothetical protein
MEKQYPMFDHHQQPRISVSCSTGGDVRGAWHIQNGQHSKLVATERVLPRTRIQPEGYLQGTAHREVRPRKENHDLQAPNLSAGHHKRGNTLHS